MTNKFQFTHQKHDHNLRSSKNLDLVVPRPKKEMFRKSLDYSGPKLWNDIPLNIRNCETVKQFQALYLKWHFTSES